MTSSSSSVQRTSNASMEAQKQPQQEDQVGTQTNTVAFGALVGCSTWLARIAALRLPHHLWGYSPLFAGLWFCLALFLTMAVARGNGGSLASLAQCRFWIGASLGSLVGSAVLDPLLLGVSLKDQYVSIGLYAFLIALVAVLDRRANSITIQEEQDDEAGCPLLPAEVV